jgi:hypothetical protein
MVRDNLEYRDNVTASSETREDRAREYSDANKEFERNSDGEG